MVRIYDTQFGRFNKSSAVSIDYLVCGGLSKQNQTFISYEDGALLLSPKSECNKFSKSVDLYTTGWEARPTCHIPTFSRVRSAVEGTVFRGGVELQGQ
jgi:hypothetical protein